MKNGKPLKDKIPFEFGSGNVFADLDLPNPEGRLAKAKLVLGIEKILRQKKIKLSKATDLLGISKKQLSELLLGNFEPFSIEPLFRFFNALNHDVEIVIKPTKKKTRSASTKVISL